MNIGLVVHHFDRSEGTGGYVVELANRFAEEHHVTIYAAGIGSPVPEGARVIRVPAIRARAYSTILTFPAAFAVVRRRHDIVHAQGWVAGHADVVTAHIVLGAWRERARAAGVRSAPGERWLGGLVTSRESRLLRDRARAVIAPSLQVRNDLARLYGRESGVHVVPHGFALHGHQLSKPEARKSLNVPADHFVALYVGDARKGLRPAIDALALTPNAHLLVLSGSPREPFLARAGAIGVAGRVSWQPHTRDPGPAYAAADALVHPTIYDTFGLAVAEAMVHGLPVVVSRAAGVSELLEHGVSGWLLNAPTSEETAAALTALMHDPELRYRLGSAGKSVAARRTWDDVAEDTLRVYHNVRKGKREEGRGKGKHTPGLHQGSTE